MTIEHVDVLIVGAGLSGIGAACHLRRECPDKSVAVLESRDAIGGTWDLFRYPGIRSDSDMFTLGYSFKPWTAAKAIADGDSIRDYVRETAREYGVDEAVRFGHRVVDAAWDSGTARWTVTAERTGPGAPTSGDSATDGPITVRLSCSFLYVNAGYYRYDEGFSPTFEGVEDFEAAGGTVVHPQHWPDGLDHAGKRVVVIGSGATAVTLVPAMAERAEHVTMLQRTPTWIVSLPGRDALADLLRELLPASVAYPLVRWKNVGLQLLSFQLSRHAPWVMKAVLRKAQQRRLPDGFDLDTHLTPPYDPWDQRLCLIPDGDFFASIRSGKASIATDRIVRFTGTGLSLASGAELAADVIVTATGLNLQAVGGMRVSVDGAPVRLPDTVAYKGMMLSGVPNLAFTLGYTNASWTLRADLVAGYVCRLLKHMDRNATPVVTPTHPGAEGVVPLLDLRSGYVLRSIDQLPRQGERWPWRLHQNYPLDALLMRRGGVEDEGVRFSAPNGVRAVTDGAPVAEASSDGAAPEPVRGHAVQPRVARSVGSASDR